MIIVFIVTCILIVIGQLVLYKKLDPRESSSKREDENGGIHLEKQAKGSITDSAEENENLLRTNN